MHPHLALNDPVLATIRILGSGRAGPTLAALLGLAAFIIAYRARNRAGSGTDDQASSAVDPRRLLIPVLGVVAVVSGGIFLTAADAGPGTGNGTVGSGGAILLGVAAIVLDRIAAFRGDGSSAPGPSA